MKPLTMACLYAFYCPCAAPFDDRLYTYSSLTKGKMTHPFQTAYSKFKWSVRFQLINVWAHYT